MIRPMPPKPLDVLHLAGSPEARGRGQAALPGVDAAAVRAGVADRVAAARAVIDTSRARDYLARQRGFAERHAAPEMAEFDGVCAGFGIDPADLFALFNLSILSGRYEADGCTAWARPLPGGGAVLAKNRDLSGSHRQFQAVFRHDDPASPVGPVLNVGTIGAPGVYSSGINAAGLALADTAVSAPRHGIGWLRYLLMTRILHACGSVPEALDLIGSARHAGGGSLILADAAGAVAAVELFADGARIERGAPAWRTNHFLAETAEATAARGTPAGFRSTVGRREQLGHRLDAGLGLDGVEAIAAAMASHSGDGVEGLCRHGESDGSHTVSTAIYTTADRALTFARGRPCEPVWEAGRLDTAEARP